MQFIRFLVISALLGGTMFAGVATFRNYGAQSIKHPEGISLRQESVQKGPKGFFPHYRHYRIYRGGGFRGGK